MRTVTFFSELMRLARAEAKARLYGTPEEYAEAKALHEAYRDACLRADEMVIPKQVKYRL